MFLSLRNGVINLTNQVLKGLNIKMLTKLGRTMPILKIRDKNKILLNHSIINRTHKILTKTSLINGVTTINTIKHM